MLFRSDSSDVTLHALEASFAVIEFKPTGEILRANDVFCSAMGYAPSELVSQHHTLFVSAAEAASW